MSKRGTVQYLFLLFVYHIPQSGHKARGLRGGGRAGDTVADALGKAAGKEGFNALAQGIYLQSLAAVELAPGDECVAYDRKLDKIAVVFRIVEIIGL